jgi:hypothetical protein
MRRATNTINYSAELPLAQGIKFDIADVPPGVVESSVST